MNTSCRFQLIKPPKSLSVESGIRQPDPGNPMSRVFGKEKLVMAIFRDTQAVDAVSASRTCREAHECMNSLLTQIKNVRRRITNAIVQQAKKGGHTKHRRVGFAPLKGVGKRIPRKGPNLERMQKVIQYGTIGEIMRLRSMAPFRNNKSKLPGFTGLR